MGTHTAARLLYYAYHFTCYPIKILGWNKKISYEKMQIFGEEKQLLTNCRIRILESDAVHCKMWLESITSKKIRTKKAE